MSTVNRAGLAAAMGVSEPTVDRWVKEGCPAKTRGRRGVEWQFNLPDVIAWWGARERDKAAGADTTDETELRRRGLVASTGKLELEFAIARREVAPVDEFERAQAKLMATIQTNMLNVPARAVLQLLGEKDETVFKQKLRAEITLALQQSAEAELDLDDETDE